MALVKWRPFERDWMDQMREMGRFLEGSRRSPWGGGSEIGAWTPLVNIYDRGESVVVEADLPEMQKDAIDVRVENGNLTLSGERKGASIPETDYYRHECDDGGFCRSFILPSSVDPDKVDATCKNRVLMLTLQKIEAAKAKRIAIH